jgi:hypothetical protein
MDSSFLGLLCTCIYADEGAGGRKKLKKVENIFLDGQGWKPGVNFKL